MFSKRFLLMAALALLPLFPSCVPETSTGNDFEARFELDTPVFYDGDEVSFSIYTNRSSVKVTAFDFRESPDFVAKNKSYSVSDGVWRESHTVSVTESRRGKMSITVQDPVTGKEMSFSAVYTANAATDIRLKIENEVVKTSNVKANVATVVDGDDFVFTIRSSARSLVLKDYLCEFNDGQLEKGKEYAMDDYGVLRIEMKQVTVTRDDYDEPTQMSLTFLNPETKREVKVTDEYVKVKAFEPTVTISPTNISDGDTVYLTLGGNRRKYKLASFSFPDWLQFGGLYGNSNIELNSEDKKIFESSAVSLQEDSSGDMTFLFKDSEYSNREKVVRVSYTAVARKGPKNVVVDKTEISINNEENIKVNVSTDDTYSTNQYHVQMLNKSDAGKLRFYAPEAGKAVDEKNISESLFKEETDVTNGVFYIRGGATAGQYAVKVSSKNYPDVFTTVTVNVRQDVAIRLKGYFYDFVVENENDLGSEFSNLTPDVGWYGFPRSIEAELVKYERASGTGDITNVRSTEYSLQIKTSALGDAGTTSVTISFMVSVGNSRVSSNGFYKPYRKMSNQPQYYLWDNPAASGADRKITAVLPESNDTIISENSSSSSKVSCDKLTEFLQDLDCKTVTQWCTGWPIAWGRENGWITPGPSALGTFDIRVYNVKYDTKKYNVKYIFSLFEVPGQYGLSLPWWTTLDGTRNCVEKYEASGN